MSIPSRFHRIAKGRAQQGGSWIQGQIALRWFRPRRWRSRTVRRHNSAPAASAGTTLRIPGCKTRARYHPELLVRGRGRSNLLASSRPGAIATDVETRYRQRVESVKKRDRPRLGPCSEFYLGSEALSVGRGITMSFAFLGVLCG